MNKIKISIVDARQSKKPSIPLVIWRAVATAAILFGPGLLANSAAMQWAGFVVLLCFLLLVLIGYNNERLTISEARKRLDKLEQS